MGLESGVEEWWKVDSDEREDGDIERGEREMMNLLVVVEVLW